MTGVYVHEIVENLTMQRSDWTELLEADRPLQSEDLNLQVTDRFDHGSGDRLNGQGALSADPPVQIIGQAAADRHLLGESVERDAVGHESSSSAGDSPEARPA